jgi:hypothetical protein
MDSDIDFNSNRDNPKSTTERQEPTSLSLPDNSILDEYNKLLGNPKA